MPNVNTIVVSAGSDPFVGITDGQSLTITRHEISGTPYSDQRNADNYDTGDLNNLDVPAFLSIDDTGDKTVGDTLTITYYGIVDEPSDGIMCEENISNFGINYSQISGTVDPNDVPSDIDPGSGTYIYVTYPPAEWYMAFTNLYSGDGGATWSASSLFGITVQQRNDELQNHFENINFNTYEIGDEVILAGNNGHFIKGTVQTVDTSASSTGNSNYTQFSYATPGTDITAMVGYHLVYLNMQILITEVSDDSSDVRQFSDWTVNIAGNMGGSQVFEPAGPIAIGKVQSEVVVTDAVGTSTESPSNIWSQDVVADVYTGKDVLHKIQIDANLPAFVSPVVSGSNFS